MEIVGNFNSCIFHFLFGCKYKSKLDNNKELGMHSNKLQ
jgi:hypothetical protein